MSGSAAESARGAGAAAGPDATRAAGPGAGPGAGPAAGPDTRAPAHRPIPPRQPTPAPSAIRTRGRQALATALDRLPAHRTAVRAALEQEAEALRGPMAVAVTGLVSSGKSTLVNALLGDDLLATGHHPVTFAPAVLRHAGHHTVLAAGKPITMAELRELSAREPDGTRPPITRFDVRGPWPYLEWFDLIDTPGFGSGFDDDTARALAALGLTGPDVQQLTLAELVRADAVVIVLNRANLAADEASMLERFHTGEDERPPLSPITCLGVLTKVETQWRTDDPDVDPLRTGERHAARIMEQPAAARLLLRVVPVCSMVAAAAATLDEEDLSDLTELAKVPVETLLTRLKSPAHLAADPALPVARQRRAALAEKLTPYGVYLACTLIRRDGVAAVPQLREELETRSGIADLRALLVNHFGRRRDLIKVARVVSRIHALGTDLPGDARDRHATQNVLRRVTDLARDDQDLAELDLLARFYDGRLELHTNFADEFRRAAGEHGVSAAERLGLPPNTPLSELEKEAQARINACRTSPQLLDLGAVPAVKALERRYELLVDRIRTARALLEDG